MIAVIAGSTGLTGHETLTQLLNDPSYERVISVSRRPTGLQSPKLTEVLIQSLAQISQHSLELRGDDYFSCVGTTKKSTPNQSDYYAIDHDAVIAFGKIALSHGARSFNAVSAVGANEKSMFYYGRVKGETERDLSALGLKSLTLVQPALLTGDRKEHRAGESAMMAVAHGLAVVLPRAIARHMMNSASDVAARLISSAKDAAPGVHRIVASKI